MKNIYNKEEQEQKSISKELDRLWKEAAQIKELLSALSKTTQTEEPVSNNTSDDRSLLIIKLDQVNLEIKNLRNRIKKLT